MKRLGLVVNPIAGMGGSVGLKGTDGRDTYEEALRRGAVPHANERAREALEILLSHRDEIEVLTCRVSMGEQAVAEAGLPFRIIYDRFPGTLSTGKNTEEAASLMARSGVELLLFAGGDGTARDICRAVGTDIPALGIPAGVKIHSGVFAINPVKAGEIARNFLFGTGRPRTVEKEVMDIDENAFRKDCLRSRLFGYLAVPQDKKRVQGPKAGSSPSESLSQQAVAAEVVERMSPGKTYFLGPGTTIREIARLLGIRKTLLGVDTVKDGRLLASDLTEREILELAQKERCGIIVSPIGGQGHIFGRGNQQIGSRVIKIVGKENIIVAATSQKIASLGGRPLLVDTGDLKLDMMLAGPWPVVTGYRETSMYPVSY